MKEKIKSNKTILVLILLIVLLLASTYAWFINNSSVTVKGITANVQGGGNIQISKNEDEDYGISISPMSRTQTLTPVSTTLDGLKGPTFFAVTNRNKSGENPKITIANADAANYYTTTFYLKSSMDTTAQLAGITGLTSNTDLEKAIRVGLVVGEESFIFASHNAQYYGINNSIPETEVSIEDPRIIGTSDSTTAITPSVCSSANPVDICDLSANDPIAVTMYLWLEGQDEGCIDASVTDQSWQLNNNTGITLNFKDKNNSSDT